MLTNDEKSLSFDLALIWNKYLELPQEGIHDQDEFRHHLHILQRMILSRPGRREINQPHG